MDISNFSDYNERRNEPVTIGFMLDLTAHYLDQYSSDESEQHMGQVIPMFLDNSIAQEEELSKEDAMPSNYRSSVTLPDGTKLLGSGKSLNEANLSLCHKYHAYVSALGTGNNLHLQPLKPCPVVSDFVLEWYNNHLTKKSKGANHPDNTYGAIQRHVLPIIGQMRLDEVDLDTANRVMDSIKKYSKTLVKSHVLNGMRQMYKYAISKGLLEKNIWYDDMLIVKWNKLPKVKGIPADTITSVLDKLENSGTEEIPLNRRTFFMLSVYLGTRLGETFGLKWDDFDLGDHPQVHIQRSIYNARNEQGERITAIGSPKTEESDRFIPLAPEIADYLRLIPKNGAYVFEYNGSHYSYCGAQSFSKTTLKCLGLKEYHIHQVRHSWITAINSRFGLKVAQTLAGHTQSSTTADIYAEADPIKINSIHDLSDMYASTAV